MPQNPKATRTIKKIGKFVLKFLAVEALLYVIACFVLIYWPVPDRQPKDNYDYSSIQEAIEKEKEKDDTIQIKEEWITLRDGKKQFCRIYPSSNKDILIFFHGSGSESRYLKKMAQAIAQSGEATVITPDVRGHGRSEGARGDVDYIGQLEDDTEDLIAYCKQALGGQKIILAGHSSGGGFVVRYIAHPENTPIYKAILYAPYLGHTSPTVKPNSGNWVTVAVKRWVGLSMWNHLGVTRFNHMPVLFFNRPAQYSDSLQGACYSYAMALNFGTEEYQEDIEKIKIPCLALVGEKDESFYPEQFKPVFEPAQRFVTTSLLKEGNHLNIVSAEESIRQTIEWLRK